MSRFTESDLAEFVARGARAAATAGAACAAAGAPAPARRGPRHIEDGLQRAVCQFWELAYPETWRKTWHTPNGLAAKNPKLAGIFKGLGMKAGVFDLVCIARRGPYSGFALELKQTRGRASEHQNEWAEIFYGERWCVAIAFSLDAALDDIRRYHELPVPHEFNENSANEYNERLRVLASFLRSQALLTDGRPHVPGVGGVNVNRDEAILLARAIDELRQGEHYLGIVAGYLHEQSQVPGRGGSALAGDISLGHRDALLIADAVDLLVDCRRAPA